VGLGAATQRVAALLGQDPVGKRDETTDASRRHFKSGRVARLEGGLYELLFGTVPRAACRAVETLLGVKSVYVIGITRGPRLLAGAAILKQRDPGLPRAPAIEAFARQASVALQRKASEDALRESEKRFRELVEDLREVIYELGPGGEVKYVSPASVRVLGYPPDELVGRRIFEFVATEDAEALKAIVDERIRSGLRSGTEIRVRTKSGEHRWIRAHSKAVLVDGRPVGVRGVCIDVTEEHLLRERLADAAAEEQHRLGRDLHDGLGQELTGIACLAAALEQDLAARGAPEREHATRLSQLIEDARHHTRDLAGLLNPVGLEAGGLARGLERLAARVEETGGVACGVTIDGDPAAAEPAAAMHLYRIAQQAVDNAVSHGKADSIHVALSFSEDRVGLAVEDDGTGLPEDWDLRGGMGLKTMRYRAALLAGTLSVDRRESGGTVVRCSMPRSSVERGRR
jgi:PAS domain S-box-containing protein